MSKPVVVLADMDNNYLAPLELKFVEELDDNVELEIITDKSYLKEYFSTPKTIEILVISEEQYNTQMQKHNVSNVFLLADNIDIGGTEDLSVNKIFKYTSTKEIFNEIMYKSELQVSDSRQSEAETQVVVVYSAAGGIGKTTVALGISGCLSENYKNVLYVDAEYIQNFHKFMSNKMTLPSDVYREMTSENEKIYFNTKHHIRKEEFAYLPPFCAAISSLNIKYSMYANYIKMAKESKEYDFIVVDVDSVFNDEKAELLSMADKVLIVINQNTYSIFKTENLLNNINCKDNEKYIFICNGYKSSEADAILNINERSNIVINDYVEFIDNASELSLGDMLKIDGFQKIAYTLY